MGIAWWVLVLAVAGGCKSRDPGERVGKESVVPEAVPERVVVVVDGSASLYTRPGGPAVEIGAGAAPRAFRLIWRDGEWAEIETTGVHREMTAPPRVGGNAGELRSCHEVLDGLSAFRLRLFVRAADLLSVTNRPIRIENGDGTWAEIGAGVAIGPEKEGAGRRRVFGQFPFDAAIPDDAIADSIVDTEAVDAGRPEGRPDAAALYVTWEVQAQFGDQSIRLMPRWPPSNIPVEAAAPDGETTLVTIGEGCLRLGVRVRSSEVTPESTSGYVNRRWPDELEGPMARQGAAVYWPDGSRAGVVHAPTRLGGYTIADSGRLCFARSLFGVYVPTEETPVLRMCLAASGVAEETTSR